jgi:hypothetical protein
MKRSIVCFLIIILIILYLISIEEMKTIKKLYNPSIHCNTYTKWTKMVRDHCFIRMVPIVIHKRPTCPHFILMNHIKSHLGIGSHLAGAHICGTDDCTIICYKNYTYSFPFISDIFHNILQHEIQVYRTWSKEKKEMFMVEKIEKALQKGKNIIMFIDTQKIKTHPMRGLNRAVLNHFPHVPKQLYHIHDLPYNTRTISYMSFPSTYDTNDIIETRKRLLHIN